MYLQLRKKCWKEEFHVFLMNFSIIFDLEHSILLSINLNINTIISYSKYIRIDQTSI